MTVLSADCAGDMTVVTPSDSTTYTNPPFRALRAAAAGNIQVTTMAGNVRVCAFAAGETRPIAGTKVWSTNTTAIGIEAYH